MTQHLQPNTTLQGGKIRIERVLEQRGFGRVLIGILLILFPVFVMAQASGGQVRRPVKKQQANTRKPSQKQSTPTEKTTRETIIQRLVNNMVFVEGGTFTMGCTSELEKDARNSAKPTHQVTLSSFQIGKFEVTQEEWQAVMGSNPSKFKGNKHPVENVSWNDCQVFIQKLNDLTGKWFRLPTEAEWEYAARGGRKSLRNEYSGSNNLDIVAWHCGNSGSVTHDVGKKAPNELGIHDMSGNVFEWCQDRFANYNNYNQTNPTGPSSNSDCVYRGGSWYYDIVYCRVWFRNHYSPFSMCGYLGLRLAM